MPGLHIPMIEKGLNDYRVTLNATGITYVVLVSKNTQFFLLPKEDKQMPFQFQLRLNAVPSHQNSDQTLTTQLFVTYMKA